MFRVALAALLSFPLLSISVAASEINVSGSTSVARIMGMLAEQYNQSHPESYVAVQGIGSTAGVTMLKKNVTDLGMSSRYLTESEQGASIAAETIAMDGLAIIVNKSNPIENITREQLYDIYKGKITNWQQLGGHDQKISAVTREASSGSQYSFDSLLGLTRLVNEQLVSDASPDNLVVNSNSMMKTLVNHNTHAIGFISLGSVDSSVKALKFEGVSPLNQFVADGTYELARPFIIFYNVDKVNEQTQDFLRFLRSDEAKRFISSNGYTAVK